MRPWVCDLWLPFLAPPGRVCYMETGWDGRKEGSQSFGLQSPMGLEKVDTGE